MIFSTLAVVVAAVASPLLLGYLDAAGGNWDWQRLSAIGETYGAASALLSALAIGGVSLSLVLQARQTNQARTQAARQMHLELVKIAFEEPAYLACFGEDPAPDGADARQLAYVNLIVSNWMARWDLRIVGEAPLRAAAANLFRTDIGRVYWDRHGPGRIRNEPIRRRRRILAAIDAEYQAAVRGGPPDRPVPGFPAATAPPPSGVPQPAPTSGATTGAFLAGAAATAAVVLLAQRASRRRQR